MTNNSINPLFVSALDILTGALGVFIIINFLNTRTAGVAPPKPEPVAAKVEPKPERPRPTTPSRRETYPTEARWTGTTKPAPAQPAPTTTPTTSAPVQKPEPATTPVEHQPPTPPQDPVSVDLMKQTKGAVTLLLQQDGKAKQSVEFMLRQGSKTWKPSRASKYQNEEFKYEKSLNYFYQEQIQPGTYEVLVRVKRSSRNAGAQTFSMFGKIIPPGQKTQTQQLGTYSVGTSDDWVNAGTFTVSPSGISFKSTLPPASANKPAEEPVNPQPEAPKTKPKKVGKWG